MDFSAVAGALYDQSVSGDAPPAAPSPVAASMRLSRPRKNYDLGLRLTWRYEVGLVDEPLAIKRGGHPDQLSALWVSTGSASGGPKSSRRPTRICPRLMPGPPAGRWPRKARFTPRAATSGAGKPRPPA